MVHLQVAMKKTFGNPTKDLENDHTFGDDKCPATMHKACECLMNHKKCKPKNNGNGNNSNNSNQNNDDNR